jgi:uncharacterized membrane protein YagU involved in acid resistance
MNALEIIVISGTTSAVIDILTTMVITSAQGMPPKKLLQFIASGALGDHAFEGRASTAFVGLGFHCVIALAASTAYFLAASAFPSIPQHPVISGIAFGMAVQVFMSSVVVPLSRTPKVPFTLGGFLTQLTVNAICVGFVIALMQSFLSAQPGQMQSWSMIVG